MSIYGKETHTKPFDIFLKENYPRELIGIEIGVSEGIHARGLLEDNSNIKKLYLIDPYIPYQDGKVSRNWGLIDITYNIFKCEILNSDLINKIEFIKKTSEDAIVDIKEEVDFIYIDGNHSYDFVKKDINLYYEKVKNGGLVGGDDYNYGRFPGVKSAVDEFVKEHNLKLYSEPYDMWTSKNSQGFVVNNDWWIVKP